MTSRWALLAVAVGLGVFVAAAAHEWSPRLTHERAVFTATPGLYGLVDRTDVRLRPGARLCMAPVPFSASTARANLSVNSLGSTRPQPLAVVARSRGWRSSSVVRDYAAEQSALAVAALRPPLRQVDGRLCVRNLGRRTVALIGTKEPRSLTPVTVSVDGRPEPGDVALTLTEAREHTVLDRLGDIFANASVLSGGVLPSWLLWPLAVGLTLLAGPALFAAAYAALRADGDRGC